MIRSKWNVIFAETSVCTSLAGSSVKINTPMAPQILKMIKSTITMLSPVKLPRSTLLSTRPKTPFIWNARFVTELVWLHHIVAFLFTYSSNGTESDVARTINATGLWLTLEVFIIRALMSNFIHGWLPPASLTHHTTSHRHHVHSTPDRLQRKSSWIRSKRPLLYIQRL